jgi:hypothetical protein
VIGSDSPAGGPFAARRAGRAALWAYLRDVLDRVSAHPASRIDELLPDHWETIRRRRQAAAPAEPVDGTADPPEPGAEPEGERSRIRDGP